MFGARWPYAGGYRVTTMGGTMRSVRILLGVAGGLVLFGMTAGCQTAVASTTTAHVAGGNSVQVSPRSVAPGGVVAIRASCTDGSTSATVSSLVFTSVTMVSQNAQLAGQATVPATTAPGTFAVDLTCSSGSTATTSITITGSTAVPATVGPHTGGGFLANGGRGGSGFNAAPTLWILGGVTTIAAAAAVATVGRRRRPVRVRSTDGRGDPPLH